MFVEACNLGKWSGLEGTPETQILTYPFVCNEHREFGGFSNEDGQRDNRLTWTQGAVGTEELLAGSKLVTFGLDAFVIVDVVLEAVGRSVRPGVESHSTAYIPMSGLVRVGKPGCIHSGG